MLICYLGLADACNGWPGLCLPLEACPGTCIVVTAADGSYVERAKD
jgi:hypothetical protein